MGSHVTVGYDEDCEAHEPGPGHPDSPDRLDSAADDLRDAGCPFVEPTPIDPSDARVVHDASYLESLPEHCEDGHRFDDDTVASPGTWPAVLAAAGTARWAADHALDTDSPTLGLTRPPGHHAVPDSASGFCFLNNAALAAEWALERPDVDRVAILDWDVHHGDGTQAIFEDRGDVHYLSVHEDGLYPGTGTVDEIGVGAGTGATLNCPLPANSDGAAYRLVARDLLEPALAVADPDLLVCSAGFDAHRHDNISTIRLTTGDYGWLAGWTRTVADALDAPLAMVLEGGYRPKLLGECLVAATEAMEPGPASHSDDEPPSPDDRPSRATRQAIDGAASVWPVLG